MATTAQTPAAEPQAEPVMLVGALDGGTVQADQTDQTDQTDSPLPLSLPDSTLADPSLLDHRRYWANRAGQSVAELAKAEGVEEAVITASLLRVRNDNERYSSLGAGVEVRKLLFQALPKIRSAIDEALGATRLEGKEVIIFDKETGLAETSKEPIERPDHDIRLRAIDGVRTLLSVVQPRDPAVQITTNTQTNVLNQAALPAGGAQAGLTSPEAVIRSIVAARQHALTDGRPSAEPLTIEATEGGQEEMPRVRKNDLDEDELEEAVDGEEVEDEDNATTDDDEEDT